MSLKDAFYDGDARPSLGTEGPCWNGVIVGDFIRGRIVRAQVVKGTKMDADELVSKAVVVLEGVEGQRTDKDTGSAFRFRTSAETPRVSIVADGARGGALAKALDQAAELVVDPGDPTTHGAPAGLWLQVRYIGQGKPTERGRSAPKHWEIKVWVEQPRPGLAPIVTRTMGEQVAPRLADAPEAVAL